MSTSSRTTLPDTSPEGTTERPTLPPIDCAEWCEVGDGHVHEFFPDDQQCRTSQRLELARDPQKDDDGWYRQTLDTFLWRKPFREPAVDLVINDEDACTLTVPEARLFAERLLALCDLAEGAQG